MRRYLPLLVVTALLSLAASAASSPTAQKTASCTRSWANFYVQLTGDRDAGWRGWALKALPDETSAIAVWSLGGKSMGGTRMYGWTTATRSWLSPTCSPVKAGPRPASLSGLGEPIRVEDGWNVARKISCLQPGRFLVSVDRTPRGTRLTVRMQKSGEVVAVGQVGGGKGWLRGSKRCETREA